MSVSSHALAAIAASVRAADERRGSGLQRRRAEGGRRLAGGEHAAPGGAVGSELRPLQVVEVEHVERLAERARVRHARRARRPLVRHPRREHAARQPVKVHAAHVPRPAQLAPRHVEVDRVDTPSCFISDSVEM